MLELLIFESFSCYGDDNVVNASLLLVITNYCYDGFKVLLINYYATVFYSKWAS